MVTFGPMVQVGCRSASSTVMASNVCGSRSRKGPPLAVSTNARTDAALSPRRHCHRALCSLSTGRIRAPDAAARARTSSPAMTSTSLVAVATVRAASSAASVRQQRRGAGIATQTTSDSIAAISHTASIPAPNPVSKPLAGARRRHGGAIDPEPPDHVGEPGGVAAHRRAD